MGVTHHRYSVAGWGVGEIWMRDEVVVHHELPAPAPPAGANGSPDPVVTELTRRFGEHLAGIPVSYDDVTVDDTWCTPLERQLLEALRAVPWGEVVAYGELAALAGRPRAARAAGTFCAGNRFSLLVPCHRVVAADGIGGYGASGVELKRRLLALEGVEL